MSCQNKNKQQWKTKHPYLGLLLSWYESKSPVFQFSMKFVGLVCLFYAGTILPIFQQVVSIVANVDAWLSGVILRLMGEDVHVFYATLASNKGPLITVLPACTAIEFMWYFSAAIIAFPASYRQKIIGILIGAFFLFALNLIRLISVYLVGIHFPGYMAFVHEQLWVVPLNSLTIGLMLAWILWTKRNELPSAI